MHSNPVEHCGMVTLTCRREELRDFWTGFRILTDLRFVLLITGSFC